MMKPGPDQVRQAQSHLPRSTPRERNYMLLGTITFVAARGYGSVEGQASLDVDTERMQAIAATTVTAEEIRKIAYEDAEKAWSSRVSGLTSRRVREALPHCSLHQLEAF